MTVRELIEKLQALPPDDLVVVRGYEDGYNDISQIIKLRVRRHDNVKHWWGNYDEDETGVVAFELYGKTNSR